MKLLAGLGNPDPCYKLTRHNAGFMVIDYLAEAYKIRLRQNKYGASFGQGQIEGHDVTLAQPMSYMNLSGQPVSLLLSNLKLTKSDLLVICDDFNLPLGSLRLRGQGSAGGHNGLKSIISSLHSDNFARLRLGVGPPVPGKEIADFVLEPFRKSEWPEVEKMIESAANAVETYLNEGLASAMNKFN